MIKNIYILFFSFHSNKYFKNNNDKNYILYYIKVKISRKNLFYKKNESKKKKWKTKKKEKKKNIVQSNDI